MHPSIDLFCKMSLRYELQQKNKIAQEFTEQLKDKMPASKLNIVKKSVKSKITKQNNIAKQITQKDTNFVEHAKAVHRQNVMKFIISELRLNMPITTMLKKRIQIASHIIRGMDEGASYHDAKHSLYQKHNVFVSYKVPIDDNVTTMEDMHIEREFDELLQKIIYGWDDDGEALYAPTFGAIITPPIYVKGGPMWKRILNHRWEQRSEYDDDEMLENYDGNDY